MAMIGQIYVCVRVDYGEMANSGTVGVETLAYTESMDDGTHIIEMIASRDAFGRTWNYDVDGDPFFDIDDPDEPGTQRELPTTRFLVWDQDDDAGAERAISSVVSSISLYSSLEEDPKRSVIRGYKLCRTNPSVDSFVKATTEGDLELVRQVTSGEKIFR